MHPFFFQIGGLKFPTYGLMAAIGLVLASAYLFSLRGRLGLSREKLSDLIFAIVLCGFAGGKLFYVVTYWHEFGPSLAAKLKTIIFTFQYGFVFYGGFLFAAAAAFIRLRKERLSFLSAADHFAPALALGHVFGRLGCFFAGCCHGRPTGSFLGVVFTDPLASVAPSCLGIAVHPAQLYEAAGNFLVFLALNSLIRSPARNRAPAGLVFAAYVFLYSVLRFIIEFFRGDDRGVFHFGLSPAQGLSAALALCSVVFAVRRIWQARNP